ncbi:MAG: hypothetical protein AABY27_05275 [Pseudomonadota bacterium]|mgnify:CR=1 FL=1
MQNEKDRSVDSTIILELIEYSFVGAIIGGIRHDYFGGKTNYDIKYLPVGVLVYSASVFLGTTKTTIIGNFIYNIEGAAIGSFLYSYEQFILGLVGGIATRDYYGVFAGLTLGTFIHEFSAISAYFNGFNILEDRGLYLRGGVNETFIGLNNSEILKSD